AGAMIGGRGPVHMVRGTTMPAAVYRGEHTISVVDVPMPQMGPSQVLLQVSHCGICGTDLHLMMEDWGAPGAIGGHEYSGVAAVALRGVRCAGVTIGDRVLVTGAGPIGLLTAAILSAEGVTDTRSANPAPSAVAWLSRWGRRSL